MIENEIRGFLLQSKISINKNNISERKEWHNRMLFVGECYGLFSKRNELWYFQLLPKV